MPTTKRDYYEILGLERSASEEVIKKTYRTLAMKHHPDRVGAEHKKEAEEKFKEISEAYAVLTDPKKRQVYDQYGHQGFDQRYSTEDIFRGADFSSVFGDQAGASIFEELLGGLFGGSFRGAGGRGRGADLEYELELEFEEAAKGIERTVAIARREACTACRGQGGERATCGTCHGAGQVQRSTGFFMMATTCGKCQGQGSTVTKACPTCRGNGRVQVERTIHVKVPAGIESGMRLRVSGEGEGGVRGHGDLYVLVSVRPHAVFEREGAHILLTYPVTIAQAALGDEVDVPTLNGRVSMKVPAGTQSGTVFRVRGKGMPSVHDGRQGDLLVRVQVETPTHLTGRQKQLLEEFAKTAGANAQPTQRSFLEQIKRVLR